MRYRILLFLLLLLPAWVARAQAPTWQSVTGLNASAGAGIATVRGTAIDANGDYYAVGWFSGSLTLGSTTLTSSDPTADQDFFVAKMSGTTNNWLWAKSSPNSNGNDQAAGVTVSGTTVYVTGFYTTAATISGTALTSVGGQDIFVARYTTAGADGSAVSGGGGGSDQGYDVAVNGSSVYITGFMSTNPTTPIIAGSTLTGAGGQDIFVARYTDNGTNLLGGGARSGGSASSERGRSVAVSGSSVYVTGQFLNTATISGTSLTSQGSLDMFVAKYTDTGSGLAENGAIRGGGSAGSDIGYNITAVGSSPTILYVGGTFNGAATISGTSLTAAGASQDVYLARFTDSGSGVTSGYARSDGAANSETLSDLAVSGTTLYAAGSYTTATTLAGTSLTSNSDDAFVAKYTDNGTAFVSVGAIDGGANASGGAITFASTIATNGIRTFLGGGVDSPATFGSIPVAAGNTGFVATLSSPATTVTSIVPTGANPTNAASVTYTVTFAASVAGLTTANFATVNGGSVTGSSVTSVSGSGTTYSVVVNTGSGSGTLGLNLVNDTGLNPSISNDPFTGQTVTIDKTAPTVAITSTTAASGGTSSATPFAYTVTFSENVTGFAAGDVTVTNGTISGFAGTSPGTTFTFNVTPTALGAVTVSVPANVAQDAAGNFNTAAPATYTITFVAPTIAVAPATLPNGTVATAYSQTLTASGGTAPYTYAITAGALPAGLTLSSAGVLAGTPTAGGSFTFTVRATDASAAPGPYNGSRAYTLTIAAPTITVAPATLPNGATGTAYSQTITAAGGTAPYTFAITAGALPAGLTLTSGGVLSGTPTAGGSFTFTVTATDASTGSGPYSGSRSYTLTIVTSTTTVVSVTRLTPSPTATASVSYRVIFAASVTGVTVSNFTTTNSGTTVTGSSVSSVSGSGTTYTVVVNTGTGNGTLRLDVANSTGITPTASNVPYTSGEVYTITKSFAAAPQLTIVGTGGTGSDVTAFVDVVRVLSGGSPFANGLQNSSFEAHDPLANGDFGYNPTGASWTFNAQSGIAESGSAFTPTTPIPNGIAVAFLQSSGSNGQLQQNLALPTGNNYQVNFQAAQRVCCTTLDQALNVFLNGVFLGTIQPGSSSYSPFTSATFAVTAPALTATITSATAANGGSTSTAPIAYTVTFSQAVTGFSATGVSVSNGTVSGFSGSGTTYTFNVTPTANGAVAVSVPANSAVDANNTGNSAAGPYTITYTQPVTAAPAVTAPGNGSLTNTATPTYTGTAVANSTVTVYVDGTSIGTTTATAGGAFSLAQPSALAQGSHTVYATAQTSGSSVSANSATNTFTVDTVRPSVAITSSAGASGSTTTTSPIPYTVTFSETVTGFVAGDVTVTNGTISGFTAVSGTVYTFNVTPTTAGTATTVNVPTNVAQDAAGNFNTAAPSTYSITFVAPTIVLAPATLPAGTVASAYSQTITASGGTAPYTYTITAGALPSGLTLSSAGVLSGTPTAGGSFAFTVRATDASAAPGPYNGSLAYTLTIAAPTITLTPTTLPAGTVASAYSQAITASGGTAPYTYAVTAGALPTGLTLSAAGVLSGTATASGTFNFTVTATDVSTGTGPYSGSRAYSVTIGSQPVTAAPVLTNPTNGSFLNTTTPAYSGTAVANSTVTVYVDGTAIGTTTATAGGAFSLAQPSALAQGAHTVYATAQTSGSAVSGNSNTNTFTVDTVQPTVAISSTTAANGGTSGSATFAYTVTFSESVTGFTAGGVSVTNGTISGFTAVSGTVYTFNVTPTTAGTATTVNVPANVAQDGAGNFNTAAPSTYSITYLPTSVAWNGSVSSDWFTAGNWTPTVVPTTAIDATIPASAPNMPAIGAGTALVKALTLNAGATLTQTGGTLDVRANLTNNGTLTATGGTVVLGSTTLASILGSSNTRFWNLNIGTSGAQSSTSASTSVQRLFTLNGNFSTQGNPLTLESNATTTAMVVNNAGTVIGTTTVQRYIDPSLNAGLGYRHYSSPVVSTTVADLATNTGFTPVVTNAYNISATPATVTPFPTVFGYDEARVASATNNLSAFDKGWVSPTATTDALTVGRGYTVNLDASQTVDLVGTLNTGTVAVGALTYSGLPASGWQLLGNPYPAPLDWNVARTGLPTGVIDAVYTFKSATQYTGSYQFYQNGFGTLPGGLIGSMQGFFLRVSQNVPAFSFQNSWRSTVYQNPTFNRGTTETRPAVQLDLVSATGTHEPTFVYFENGATAGFDAHYDADKLSNSTGLNLSSEIAGGQRLAVNGLPVLATATVTVPLTVGVPAAGSFSFNAAQLLNLSTTPVYLRDRQTGAVVDLARQPNYSFVVSNASALITGRFELVFSPQAVLATAPAALAAQVGLYPNPASKVAFIELPATLGRVAVTAKLVDALGRSVQQVVLPAQGAAAHRLELDNVATGVYTLHLATSAGVLVKKLVVE